MSAKDEQALREAKNASSKPTMKDKKKHKKANRKSSRNSGAQRDHRGEADLAERPARKERRERGARDQGDPEVVDEGLGVPDRGAIMIEH